jgi:hypothetical protein
VKINRIKDPERLGSVLSYPPTKLFFDHESVKTDDLGLARGDVGIERAVVRHQASGMDTTAFEGLLV